MTRYDLYLLDGNRNIIRLIDQYSKLEIVTRFNDVGTWLLDGNVQSFGLNEVDWKGGIRLMRDGESYFEGGFLQLDDENADMEDGKYSLSGKDFNDYLTIRLAASVPNGPPYSSAEFDLRTGAAGDVVQDYIRYHLGSLAKTARVVPGLTVAANAGIGGTVTGRGRFQSILELVQQKALEGGDIGFRFDGMEFGAFIPRDQSALVKFSRDRGTLLKYKRRVNRPTGNYIIGGGSGEGTDRDFQEASDQDSINRYGRIEYFHDYRNASGAELYAVTAGKLSELTEKITLDVQVQDTQGIQYMRDYQLGDRVTVDVPDLTYTNIIREVRLTLDSNGEQINATVGGPGARSLGTITRTIAAQQSQTVSRISIMERV